MVVASSAPAPDRFGDAARGYSNIERRVEPGGTLGGCRVERGRTRPSVAIIGSSNWESHSFACLLSTAGQTRGDGNGRQKDVACRIKKTGWHGHVPAVSRKKKKKKETK